VRDPEGEKLFGKPKSRLDDIIKIYPSSHRRGRGLN